MTSVMSSLRTSCVLAAPIPLLVDAHHPLNLVALLLGYLLVRIQPALLVDAKDPAPYLDRIRDLVEADDSDSRPGPNCLCRCLARAYVQVEGRTAGRPMLR